MGNKQIRNRNRQATNLNLPPVVVVEQVVIVKQVKPYQEVIENKVLNLLQKGWQVKTILSYLKSVKIPITRQVIRNIKAKHKDKIVEYEWYF